MKGTDGQLFKKYVDKMALSNAEIARMLGVKDPQIIYYFASKKFQRGTLKKIQTVFPDFTLSKININEESDYMGNGLSTPNDFVNEPKSESNFISQSISVYDIDFKAGFKFDLLKSTRIMGSVNLPNLSGAEFIVRGKLLGGNYVGLRKMLNKDAIYFGSYYGVATHDNCLLAQIKKGSTDQRITLIPETGEVDSFELSKAEICDLFLVTGAIKTIMV